MRLFIAIEFNNEIKNKLLESSNIIKHNSYSGNFSRIENFHITLAFLGEVESDNIEGIKNIMDEVNTKPFKLSINNFDCFSRDNESLIYRKVYDNRCSERLNYFLVKRLSESNYPVDKKKFRPHITISRMTKLKEDFNLNDLFLDVINYDVNEISLMKSERIRGVLTYTPIYKKKLKG